MRLLDRVKTGCNRSAIQHLAFDAHAPLVGVVESDVAYRYSQDFRLTREPVPGESLVFAEHCGLAAVRREGPRRHLFSRLSNHEPLGVVQRTSSETAYEDFCLLPDGKILASYEDSDEPGATSEVFPAGSDQPAMRLLLPLMDLRVNPQLGLGAFLLPGDAITRLAFVNVQEFYIGDECYQVGGYVWSHDLSPDGSSLMVVCDDIATERNNWLVTGTITGFMPFVTTYVVALHLTVPPFTVFNLSYNHFVSPDDCTASYSFSGPIDGGTYSVSASA